ncbi:hypothetical protein Tco_1339185 [Tanacetum coccineum]
MRIKQYIQMIDYALWEVIENGATLPKTQVVECVITVMPITSAEDNAQRRLELLEAVEKRFGGNAATKKTQRNLLKHLSLEWNTHAIVRRNKAQLDTMSIDDLYNNIKVYEPEVKGMSRSSSSTQNMAFVSSSKNNTSNTNEAINTGHTVNTAHEISTANTQVNTTNSINTDNLRDAVICSFFASQLNSHQLVHEDLQQIHPYDIEEMD